MARRSKVRKSEDVGDMKDAHLFCRLSHQFDFVTDMNVEVINGRIVQWVRHWQCLRCKAEKYETIDGNDFRVSKSKIVYPDGYLSRSGRIYHHDVRREQMTRMYSQMTPKALSEEEEPQKVSEGGHKAKTPRARVAASTDMLDNNEEENIDEQHEGSVSEGGTPAVGAGAPGRADREGEGGAGHVDERGVVQADDGRVAGEGNAAGDRVGGPPANEGGGSH